MLRRAIKTAIRFTGYDIRRLPKAPKVVDQQAEQQRWIDRALRIRQAGVRKAHYGSGGRYLPKDWVNIDQHDDEPAGAAFHYLRADLTSEHPFLEAWFRFGFAEDVLEHLDQEESLRFLLEVARTLQSGGVLRLSFPGLEGVLSKHYTPPTIAAARLAETEAYTMHGHKHFYSRDELRLVAQHVGFCEVRFVEYGQSLHHELQGLDYRAEQIGLNTYAELVR